MQCRAEQLQCNAMQWFTIQCNVMLYSAMRCNKTQCAAMQLNEIQCNAMHCNVGQDNDVQHILLGHTGGVRFIQPLNCTIFKFLATDY